jgi:hypothetical protein
MMNASETKKTGVFATVNGIEIPELVGVVRGYAKGWPAKVIWVREGWIGTYKYMRRIDLGISQCGPWVMAPGADVKVEFLDGPFEGRVQTYRVAQNDDGIVAGSLDPEDFVIEEKVSDNGAVNYHR